MIERIIRVAFAAIAAACFTMLVSCGGEAHGQAARLVAGGDAERGNALLRTYGCGSCHTIPGVVGARGQVGPPLIHWSRRVYIAGYVPNTADFLIRWIEVPQAIEPATAMPNLRVTEQEARDMAAYLYTLQ
jgi:cytochrome c